MTGRRPEDVGKTPTLEVHRRTARASSSVQGALRHGGGTSMVTDARPVRRRDRDARSGARPRARRRRQPDVRGDRVRLGRHGRARPYGRRRRRRALASRRSARLASTSSWSAAPTSATSTGSCGPGRPGRAGCTCASIDGSEVFEVGRDGPELEWRRTASAAEEPRSTGRPGWSWSGSRVGDWPPEVVANRVNRRKIDLIPEPEWADPPKACIAELVDGRHRAVVGRRRGRPRGGRRDGDGCGAGGRARRPADHERRQARRDRAHRQVRLGPLGGSMARPSVASRAA